MIRHCLLKIYSLHFYFTRTVHFHKKDDEIKEIICTRTKYFYTSLLSCDEGAEYLWYKNVRFFLCASAEWRISISATQWKSFSVPMQWPVREELPQGKTITPSTRACADWALINDISKLHISSSCHIVYGLFAHR